MIVIIAPSPLAQQLMSLAPFTQPHVPQTEVNAREVASSQGRLKMALISITYTAKLLFSVTQYHAAQYKKYNVAPPHFALVFVTSSVKFKMHPPHNSV